MHVVTQRTDTVPLDSIHPSPANPNQGDVGLITESVQANGFFGSVLVQESSGAIIAGEHRWRAAKALGAQEIPVTFVDVDDERARRIMLVDNRAARQGLDNAQALADLLGELAMTPEGLVGTGFDGDALDELLHDLAAPAPDCDADAPEPDGGPGGLVVTITFPNEAARADWADFCASVGRRHPDVGPMGARLHAFVTSPEVVALLHHEDAW